MLGDDTLSQHRARLGSHGRIGRRNGDEGVRESTRVARRRKQGQWEPAEQQ
jgi:hypothetical protein